MNNATNRVNVSIAKSDTNSSIVEEDKNSSPEISDMDEHLIQIQDEEEKTHQFSKCKKLKLWCLDKCMKKALFSTSTSFSYKG